MTRSLKVLWPLILVLAVARTSWSAEPDPRQAAPHVRTTDHRLRRLLRDAVNVSSTLRTLVERLEHSDVVVYLDCGGPTAPPGGRLTFISTVAGRRYLHVRVAFLPDSHQQIAMIGHELRHAVEIADAPEVVDGGTLLDVYRRIGFPNLRLVDSIAFDSAAAVEAGYQVLREVTEHPDTIRLVRGD